MIEFPPWIDSAACKDADSRDFFANPRYDLAAEARAKMVCAECPARLLCLTWQMEHETGLGPRARYGIFGGLTGEERHQLAKGAA